MRVYLIKKWIKRKNIIKSPIFIYFLSKSYVTTCILTLFLLFKLKDGSFIQPTRLRQLIETLLLYYFYLIIVTNLFFRSLHICFTYWWFLLLLFCLCIYIYIVDYRVEDIFYTFTCLSWYLGKCHVVLFCPLVPFTDFYNPSLFLINFVTN